ncbi:Delta-aminolevulinic acid dehydratase Hemb [Methanonatronarchaeum thermophilum]|uniref:Delta-aminolevulinic acid dehydratase n=1 Tax=Methanonatronarchaeum thermophilum TaxID=1927129 RepID=A0A1Y3GAV9_9EURY|nr:porphobilinogen synthase [Methanonatronarchaeum thermophilum]OUJ18539.1 Delta-aminolevulinic acid dehydratase Hemb [Methanonatronarchaeum thermophilum]
MYPINRLRRLRNKESTRRLVSETKLTTDDLVYPLFVEKRDKPIEISSMDGVYRYPVEKAVEVAKEVEDLGIPSIILFGIPEKKDEVGSFAFKKDGVVQQALKKINKETNLTLISDVCLCEYTDHGHCGLIKNGVVDNDETLELLSKTAVSHAESGADIVAPSGMMDGMVAALRDGLDREGFTSTSILSYSAKYASNYYGPFRDAAESTPSFGDRKGYQMAITQRKEAIRENNIDAVEGADMLMVKPALPYLDIIRDTSERFNLPIAAYQVSGEYSMLKQSIKKDIMSEEVINESLISIKRAGADIIITYFAKEIAKKI